MNIQNEEIAALAVTLAPQFPDGYCMVMSIENSERNTNAGSIKEVSVQRAAQLIIEKTHKLAETEEIEVYRSSR